VTVCLAAIAEKSMIIGISDRMLTAGGGEIEFEPEQGKYWVFSPSIIALISGDATIQGELMKQVHIEVKSWINADPKKWVRVKDVASLYCQKFRELRREWAEAEILHPLGLDIPSFPSSQTSMSSDVVAKIGDRLLSYEFPSTLEVIFMGMDQDGPLNDKSEQLNYTQLYVTYNDRLSWLTTVGFAAIGIGKSHAESQFTFTGHWPLKPFYETLLLAYAAKKRAEAAPGVGKSTDILAVGPNLGESRKVEDVHMKELDKIYQKSRGTSSKATEKAKIETKAFVERVKAEAEKVKAETKAKESLPENKEKNAGTE
jgi:hypothetical protein